ncbi:dihydrofolate reductase family protein [Anaerolineales bacterium]
MRKLKLQVQMSIDAYVAGPDGAMDWMVWNWDDALSAYVDDLTDSCDTILLGKNMTEGFINHWSNVPADDPEYSFARKMMDYQKVVFSNTLEKSTWPNTTLQKGDYEAAIQSLKQADSSKDIIVYGGANFVASLIKAHLIDELHLFVNPAILGTGLSIFNRITPPRNLKLARSIPFDCGIVLLHYNLET